MAVAACARSDDGERPAGWTWFGIAIRGAEFGGRELLSPAIPGATGQVFFSHHEVLYRFDVERRGFHASRALPPHCTPAIVDADDVAWCAVDGGLAAVPPAGPARVYPLAGMTPEQHLVARGNTIWFAVPGRHAYGRFERSKYTVFPLPSSVDAREVAVGGNAVWVADRRQVVRVSQSRGLMRLELPGASASATITAIAARDDGTLFALVADTEWSVVEFSPTGSVRTYQRGLLPAGGIVVDRRGRVWIAIVTSRRPYRVGVLRINDDGAKAYNLPMLDGGFLTIDRDDRLWLAEPGLHAYAVIVPTAHS